MAKKRPAFNLPSTNTESDAPKTAWVYRSDTAAPEMSAAPETPEAPQSAETPQASEALQAPAGAPEAIVLYYSKMAAVSGLIPLPFLDVIALTGVQLKMLSALTNHYGLSFDDQLAKSLIASYLASTCATGFAYSAGSRLLRTFPLIGLVAMPLTAYSVTWTIGVLFARHFASGGTLSDYQPTTS